MGEYGGVDPLVTYNPAHYGISPYAMYGYGVMGGLLTNLAYTRTNSKTYVLGLPLSSAANGSEILTVKTLSNSIIDSSEEQVDYSLAQSNTVQLNDKAGPIIKSSALQKRNKYIDLTFNEGVYADASSSTGLSSATLSLTQPSSNANVGLTIVGVKAANNEDIITVDLNDAVIGRDPNSQLDYERELQASTGVINIKEFIKVAVIRLFHISSWR